MNNNNDTMGKPHVTPAQWEQRRYEIAKDVLCANRVKGITYGSEKDCRWAISIADELIRQLKEDTN